MIQNLSHNHVSLRLALPEAFPERAQAIERFHISIPAPSTVSVTLPAGTSKFDFLMMAQGVFEKINGTSIIDQEDMEEWHCPTLYEKYEVPTEIRVEIQQGREPKTYDEHESALFGQGRAMASQEDAAVAVVAYWLTTGTDLLNGSGVQTSFNGLQINPTGLVEIEYYKTTAVAVSGETASENS